MIQLKHMKSSRFLTVAVNENAFLERDCFQIYLDASGNDGSGAFVSDFSCPLTVSICGAASIQDAV